MTGRCLSDFDVRKMDSMRGREYICDNHYSGTCHAGPMCWGLFDTAHDDELIGVCAFATPISENVRRYLWKEDYENEMKDHTTELHRLVTDDDTPHNTETWFISRALDGLKEYKSKYEAVISFADTTEGHEGTIYQASNAIYYGTTGTHAFYRDQEGNLRAPRQNGENITVGEARERGWEVEQRSHKHRYLFLLPDPYETKSDIHQKLDIEHQDYPQTGIVAE